MYPQEREEMDFSPVTPYQAAEYQTQCAGIDSPTRKWLITDYDTVIRNPFWDGSNPDQHHPFDDCYDDEDFFIPLEAEAIETVAQDDYPF